MKRLQFIARSAVGMVVALVAPRSAAAKPIVRRQPEWAKRLLKDLKRGKRRYEHYIHASYCCGQYDNHNTSDWVAKRSARCSSICGICRWMYSIEEWPDKHYRRAPNSVLDWLEQEPVDGELMAQIAHHKH